MQPKRTTSKHAITATLLSVLACVALMLEQVRVPLHLALNHHCISHSTADSDSGHGHDHDHDHTHDHDSRPESPASHSGLHHPDEHCPHSLEDHFGELPQLALQLPSDHMLLALAPTPPRLMHVELPINGVKLNTASAPRTPPPPQKTAPRGPPSLV